MSFRSGVHDLCSTRPFQHFDLVVILFVSSGLLSFQTPNRQAEAAIVPETLVKRYDAAISCRNQPTVVKHNPFPIFHTLVVLVVTTTRKTPAQTITTRVRHVGKKLRLESCHTKCFHFVFFALQWKPESPVLRLSQNKVTAWNPDKPQHPDEGYSIHFHQHHSYQQRVLTLIMILMFFSR